MKTLTASLRCAAALALTLCAFAGCESTDGGHVHGSVYYGVGFYDPWYYGGYYDDPDIIVTPPPSNPDAPHVEHPIAKPAPAPPVARPTPSIPSAPRPAPRPSFRR